MRDLVVNKWQFYLDRITFCRSQQQLWNEFCKQRRTRNLSPFHHLVLHLHDFVRRSFKYFFCITLCVSRQPKCAVVFLFTEVCFKLPFNGSYRQTLKNVDFPNLEKSLAHKTKASHKRYLSSSHLRFTYLNAINCRP